MAAPERVESWRGEEWVVRALTGSAATRAYRCPGCDHEVRPATPHVVVWVLPDGAQERRHWHTTCWSARDSRRPRHPRRPGRSSGPRRQ